MQDQAINTIAEQYPILAALLIIVGLFLYTQWKRDKIMQEATQNMGGLVQEAVMLLREQLASNSEVIKENSKALQGNASALENLQGSVETLVRVMRPPRRDPSL